MTSNRTDERAVGTDDDSSGMGDRSIRVTTADIMLVLYLSVAISIAWFVSAG